MLPTNYSLTNPIYNVYKEEIALNNTQGMICHKTQPNRTN